MSKSTPHQMTPQDQQKAQELHQLMQKETNENFDKRMKAKMYVAKDTGIRSLFALSLVKYSFNSLKFSSDYLKHLESVQPLNYYDVGVMINLIRGVAFEMIGCATVSEVLAMKRQIERINEDFNEVANQCAKAAEKEIAAKHKNSRK